MRYVLMVPVQQLAPPRLMRRPRLPRSRRLRLRCSSSGSGLRRWAARVGQGAKGAAAALCIQPVAGSADQRVSACWHEVQAAPTEQGTGGGMRDTRLAHATTLAGGAATLLPAHHMCTLAARLRQPPPWRAAAATSRSWPCRKELSPSKTAERVRT